MAFQKGNSLGAKSKAFDGALRRAIAQDDGRRLRDAAEQLLSKAAEGEPWAIGMLADRLDGKAGQEVTIRREVGELSLAELAAEIAELRGGSDAPAQGTNQSDAVH